ncbi:DUF3592 domain-containing protein [Nitrosococcus wardiae]|uniref:DUF3592 domain-containing protein n=1 Tax=Nitrosococcus wardiae TaxID=1814290 RepID=A0A4P7C163_9GAMM|nr:DUF3592 domain-containing protein [Nitrosococcus wardiae]QBQ55369.1 DUF3592 domain-containing protein [Nitrosococcus wardiae]
MEIVFFIVGAVFVVLGGLVIWDFNRFKQSALRSIGQIVGYAVKHSHTRNSGASETYAPVVQYQASGQQHQFTASVSSSHVRHSIGDAVPILVHRHDPSRARLDSRMSQILGGVFIFIGAAAIATFISVFQVSMLSIGIAVVVIALLAVKLLAKLQRHNIYSMEDIKAAIDKIKKADTSISNKKKDYVITDPGAFRRHVQRHNSVPTWVLVILVMIGVGVISGGAYLGVKRINFLQTALTTQGTVVSLNSKTSTSDGKTTTTYYPVVEYLPPNQSQSIIFEHDIGSSHPPYRRGEKVEVLYSASNPSEAIINEGWMNYFGPGLMLIVGSVFVLVGGVLRGQKRKQKIAQHLELDF